MPDDLRPELLAMFHDALENREVIYTLSNHRPNWIERIAPEGVYIETEKSRLEQRLRGSTSLARLAREARALGYVRPGERLYIVKGIPQWRKRERASMMAHRGR